MLHKKSHIPNLAKILLTFIYFILADDLKKTAILRSVFFSLKIRFANIKLFFQKIELLTKKTLGRLIIKIALNTSAISRRLNLKQSKKGQKTDEFSHTNTNETQNS